MPREIVALSQKVLKNPARVTIKPETTTAERVDQAIYYVDKKNKNALLLHLLKDEEITRMLVFSRTKHGANKICKILNRNGIASEPIHGNKSQSARVKALEGFKAGRIRVLVATDIAARGIDIDDLSHVVQYDLPNIPETYVHRIGRTGRAGKGGLAVSFCDREERSYLRDIQRLIRQDIAVIEDHPFPPGTQVANDPKNAAAEAAVENARGGRGGRGGGNRGGGNGGNRRGQSRNQSNGGGRNSNSSRNAGSNSQRRPKPQAEGEGQERSRTNEGPSSGNSRNRNRRRTRGGGGGGGGGSRNAQGSNTQGNNSQQRHQENDNSSRESRDNDGFRGGISWD